MLLFLRNSVWSALLLLLPVLSTQTFAQQAPETIDYAETLTIADSLRLSENQVATKLDSVPFESQTALQPIRTLADSTQAWLDRQTSPVDSLLPFTEYRLPELPDNLIPRVPSLPGTTAQDLALPPPPDKLPASSKAKQLLSEGSNFQAAEAIQPVKKRGKQLRDSLDSYQATLDELNKVKEYRNRLPIDSLRDLSALGDTLVTTDAQRSEAWASQQVSEQLEGQLPEPLITEHPQEDAMRSRLTEEALTFFDGNSEKLTQAKEQLTNLKRTYRQVKEQDSVFIKNTSLEGIPTRQRLVYGINMNPSKTGLSSWQLRSQLGYQLNKVWTLGLGGQFQAGIATEPIQVNASWIGGYGFVQRAVARQFLLYTEVAQETESTLDEPSKGIAATWRGWVGIGKQISISGKLALQLLFLWDGFSGRDTPVRDQFQLRVGIIRSGTK